MKNYFKWIMLFFYLVAIGAGVNYFFGNPKTKKEKDRLDEKMEIDSLPGEPIIIDSLMLKELHQSKELIDKQ